MSEKLTKLYNTLAQIETKGENTKLMAACLNFTQQMINDALAEEAAKAEVQGDTESCEAR